jgi:hypothetical protein
LAFALLPKEEIMAAEPSRPSDRAAPAKSREIQRAMLEEMAGQIPQAQSVFDGLLQAHPDQATDIQQINAEWKRDYSAQVS